MKVYHSLNFGTYNAACYFLEQRLPITKVTPSNYGRVSLYYVGDKLVAMYDEVTGDMDVYVHLNGMNRAYGRLH